MTDLNCNKTNEDIKEIEEVEITRRKKMEKRLRHLIVIKKESLDVVCTEIEVMSDFKFLLASTDETYVYMFVVFFHTQSINTRNILYSIKPFARYMENVEFIWKKGKLVKNINCNLWQDREERERLKAKNVLSLSDESAREELDIREYYIYKKITMKLNETKESN